MSLILEALKKSEARRQLGAAPSLGTPFTTPPRRRNAWPLIVIVLGVAGALGWLYLRPRPQAAAPAATARANGSAMPTPAHRANTIAARLAPRSAPVAATDTPAPTTLPAAANPPRDNAAQRVMPANLPQPLNSAPPANAAHFPGLLRAQQPPSGAPINVAERTPAAPPADPVRAAETHAAAVPPAAPPGTPAAPNAAPAPAAVAGTPAPPAPSSLPLYYELPYDVRKDLPPLDMTMHVYAADAAQRFVVIDGERATEGATIKDSVTLRQIRPDGVVLEFHGHEFFYPRPGA